jgi:threonine/homoserine/homoserine lactone efflux protein
MSDAIGSILPAAVAIALSPIPIIAVVLMLGSSRARSNGSAFALGWLVGLVAVSIVVLVVAGGADDPNSTASDTVNWTKVGFGVLFLALAARTWRNRPARGEEPSMPKWMAEIDHFTAVRSLGLGLAVSAVNPKNLVLTIAAAATIAQAGLDTADTVIAVAVFIALASVTVVGLVLAYLVASDRADPMLASVKDFMSQHNAVIMIVLFLVLGAKMIGDGLPG